jgi:2-phospho-L-lactate transferase/gluconeogenesis factor (CofD/UPF0052 family)
VVIGPGSTLHELVPNLLVDGIADALRETSARRIYVCNVANQRGRDERHGRADHAEALLDHGLGGRSTP